MNISFTKMHGLGNDFVIMEARHLPPDLDLARLSAYVSERHFGVGSDGLIVVAPASDPEKFDIQFIFYNSDGSRAEMCGNGIRCFARYIFDQGIVPQETCRVETMAGLIQPTVQADGTVTVNMGKPILKPMDIPFTGYQDNPSAIVVKDFALQVLDRTVPVTAVSMGNPHCIIFQQDLDEPLDPAVFGPAIETHPLFPAKTNVEFVEVLDDSHLRVTVWERGCGFTLACGTGACATAVASHLLNKTGTDVEVQLPGGPLQIRWAPSEDRSVYMTGPATYVFKGEISIPDKTFLTGDVIGQEMPALS